MIRAYQNLKNRSTLIALDRSKSNLAKVPAATLPNALPSTVVYVTFTPRGQVVYIDSFPLGSI